MRTKIGPKIIKSDFADLIFWDCVKMEPKREILKAINALTKRRTEISNDLETPQWENLKNICDDIIF